MTEAVKNLKDQILQLSAPERQELAQLLYASLEDADEIAAAWEVEVQRRLAELDSGEVQGIPAEEMFKKSRERYP